MPWRNRQSDFCSFWSKFLLWRWYSAVPRQGDQSRKTNKCLQRFVRFMMDTVQTARCFLHCQVIHLDGIFWSAWTLHQSLLLAQIRASDSPLSSPSHGSGGGFSETNSGFVALRKDGLIQRVFRSCSLFFKSMCVCFCFAYVWVGLLGFITEIF